MNHRTLATLATLGAVAGCFSDDHSAPFDGGLPDGTLPDAAAPDATAADAPGPDGGMLDATPASPDSSAADAPAGDDASDAGAVIEAGCHVVSTCKTVQVKFIGWVPGSDGGMANCELRVDDVTPDGGSVYITTDAGDPAASGENTLVGDFATTPDGGVQSPLVYVNDNNACDVPDFPGRRNAYVLQSMQSLYIQAALSKSCPCGGGNCPNACDDAGTGGLCDFTNGFYSQSCPNFGFNCVDTPARIDEIQVIATSADPTCKLCIYDSTTTDPANIIKCVPPGTTLMKSDFAGADASVVFPMLVRLDDGTNCASY